jgi:phosphohistidine phosphatase
MHMYFLRHGDSSSDSRCSDSERPLTDLGIRQATLVGTLLQRMNVVIDAALSSPLRRARETTSLVLPNINKRQVSISEFLLNGSDPQELFDHLNEITASSVMLIGHEPYLSETISLLMGGDRSVEIEMKKCSLALVDISLPIHPGAGKLKFLIPVDALASSFTNITGKTNGTENGKN